MLTLLNAAPDTGNQGVSALCHSAVAGLASRGAGPVAVADHGRGKRRADWGHAVVELVGLTHHRRYWRGDSLRTAHALVRVGGGPSAAARAVLRSRAVLDVSGGDSFTDLYGERRFRAMVLTKRLALDAGVPLILLPQKLGPFRDPANRAEAVDILARAAAVWVRDAESLAFLETALGPRFDASRHRLGVDMAVALPARRPDDLPAGISALLAPSRTHPVAGLNVSGLLFNDAEKARASFGLTEAHPRQIEAAARALLDADPALKLLLVPHVHRPQGDPESDLGAARALEARLGEGLKDRVAVLGGTLDAMALKWVMGQLDWFAGARMHATIGAFSSGVPTLGLGYTDKARGVFAECGIGGEVADLRRLDARSLAARVIASYEARTWQRGLLASRVGTLRARAEREMDEIARQTLAA
jgi:polysaccharide pyruvyl transferase WcaK-like protein